METTTTITISPQVIGIVMMVLSSITFVVSSVYLIKRGRKWYCDKLAALRLQESQEESQEREETRKALPFFWFELWEKLQGMNQNMRVVFLEAWIEKASRFRELDQFPCLSAKGIEEVGELINNPCRARKLLAPFLDVSKPMIIWPKEK